MRRCGLFGIILVFVIIARHAHLVGGYVLAGPNRYLPQIFVGNRDEFCEPPVNAGAVHFTLELSNGVCNALCRMTHQLLQFRDLHALCKGVCNVFWRMALEKVVEGPQYGPNGLAHPLKPAPVHKRAFAFGVFALVPLSAALALARKSPLDYMIPPAFYALFRIFRHLLNVNVGLLVLPVPGILIRWRVVHAQSGFLPFNNVVYHRQYVLALGLPVQMIRAVAGPFTPLLYHVVFL